MRPRHPAPRHKDAIISPGGACFGVVQHVSGPDAVRPEDRVRPQAAGNLVHHVLELLSALGGRQLTRLVEAAAGQPLHTHKSERNGGRQWITIGLS
jgi:hypothetical protein